MTVSSWQNLKVQTHSKRTKFFTPLIAQSFDALFYIFCLSFLLLIVVILLYKFFFNLYTDVVIFWYFIEDDIYVFFRFVSFQQ